MDTIITLAIAIPLGLMLLGAAYLFSTALSTVVGKMTKPPRDPVLEDIEQLQEEVRAAMEESKRLLAEP
jgi:hypothetical protein